MVRVLDAAVALVANSLENISRKTRSIWSRQSADSTTVETFLEPLPLSQVSTSPLSNRRSLLPRSHGHATDTTGQAVPLLYATRGNRNSSLH